MTRRAIPALGVAAALLASGVLALLAGPPAPAADTAPVTVAAILDLTGRGAALGEAERTGLVQAEREAAARGGVAGRPLRLVVLDSATSADTAARAARLAIERERAVVLIGGTTGAPTTVLADAAQRAEVPILALAEGRGGDTAVRRWVFQVPPGTALLADAIVRDVARRGLRRFGLLEADGPIGVAGRAALEAAGRRHGVVVAARETVADASGDLTAAVTAVLEARPEAIVVWAIPPLAGALAQPILDLAPGLPHYQSHAALTSAFLPLAGAAAAGIRTVVPRLHVAEALPEGDPERARLLEFAGRARGGGATGTSPFVGYGYDALGLAVSALERAASAWGDDTPSLARQRFDVREALEGTREYAGVTGLYTYGPADHTGLDGRALVVVEAVVPAGAKVGEWRPVRTAADGR